MATTLDEIRMKGERDLESLLARLDRRHRALLEEAIAEYGSVRAVPQAIWDEIQRETEEETAAIIILLLISADEWTEDELARQGVRGSSPDQSAYALDGARRSQRLAAQTTATLRDRLARKIEDAALSGPGPTGELTREGIRTAVGEVMTDARRTTIAVDATTTSLSRGQINATRRIVGPEGTAITSGGSSAIGGDGAATVAGQRVRVELLWQTERDSSVCPRCSPLQDQPERIWSLVFPEGPGPEAHPNCRCSLSPVVVVDGGAE